MMKSLVIDILFSTTFLIKFIKIGLYDLKISNERLPGRKGVSKDLVYLPLKFRTFLNAQKVKLAKLQKIYTETLHLAMLLNILNPSQKY
ncbi:MULTISPECIES: hypothetical protein [unclassified Thermosipho (in: thermotogales)]|uniref:hypothetical protein n=1 Tax=unclassified Thermosipho (in: thermotogales) TaxID=2676525 RepID=UPI000984E7FF|nr:MULTISPECIES: hypothetical protein [unclassified Thermosipho (in: thermotogales)]MBT1247797.1 hypothetical protein [Thermosipho sp. 1244]OOC47019.1 hypothetical protein XO09_03905 [Thermosipho sp. 1223]